MCDNLPFVSEIIFRSYLDHKTIPNSVILPSRGSAISFRL